MARPTSAGHPSAPSRSGTPDIDLAGLLPRLDPVAGQTLLCQALAALVANGDPDEVRFEQLRALDGYAVQLSDRLLTAYAEGDAQLRSFDRRYFIAARRLSRAFAQAYERLLEHAGDAAGESGPPHETTILVQSCRHWQVELLLRLFRYKKRISEQWRQLNRAYRSARLRGVADEPVPRGPGGDGSAAHETVEQGFIQMLLLGAMNNGQFPPRELLWARDWIARWSRLLRLRSADEVGDSRARQRGFVVDLAGADGLERFDPEKAAEHVHLDTTPLMGAIDHELAALNRTPTDGLGPPSTERRDRQALLTNLRLLFAPDPVHIARRGERMPVAFSVHSISGLPHIVQALRADAARESERGNPAARTDEVTISTVVERIGASISASPPSAPETVSLATTSPREPGVWQVKDHSDSGCRMRGRPADLNEMVPGSLIAIRHGEQAQWTVAVVRRLRRLMVDHVEVSVEYVGRMPRFVKIVTERGSVTSASAATDKCQRSYGALYLPASDKHPVMPVKTLVVPARVFDAGRAVTLLTSAATYSLRLNDPFEQQSEFVWTSFTVIERLETKVRSPGATATAP